MSQDHHHHNDPIAEAVAQHTLTTLSSNMGHVINRTTGVALASAAGALRDRSYDYNTLTPNDLFVQPQPMDVPEDIQAMGVDAGAAVIIHNRLIYRHGSYLLIVSYTEGAPQIIATGVVEESLNSSHQPDMADCIKQEISRQIALIPPKAPGQIAMFGLTLQGAYFTPEQIDAAALRRSVPIQEPAPMPEQRQQPQPPKVTTLPRPVDRAPSLQVPKSLAELQAPQETSDAPPSPLKATATPTSAIAALRASATGGSQPDVRIAPVPAPAPAAAAVKGPRLTGLPPPKR